MKDELHRKIIEGLNGELDRILFEDAAVDLLQPIYKTLTPIKGGGDDGRDGYFFNVHGGAGPLVCTTGADVGANLRKNLQEYVKKGHKGRAAIVVTSQALTPTRINNLKGIAKEEGFRLLQVHEQRDIALKLYRNSTWLKKLLNLESNQQALSINPVTSRPVLSLSIKGREGVLDWLGKTAGDCLVVGQPGSGKTFVVREFIMGNDGLFAVSDNRDQITAEIRDKKPAFIVVDDAHTKEAFLRALRQIRQDTGAEFKIIATSWPSYRNRVQGELGVEDGAILEVELLGRDTILEIIKDCGVYGPDELLYQMVTQAEGKPGLAATLSQLVLSGNAQEVYIGDALGKHLITLFEVELGTDALDLLAVVALGGDGGITLEEAAAVLGISEMKAQTLAAKLAFGGVIADSPPDIVSVRPKPLRYYLAKQRFFNGRASIDPTKHLHRYPQLADVVEVILNAGLRGGSVDKDALYVLIEKIGSPKLFGGYAIFGQEQAEKVIKEHPEAAIKAPAELLSVCPEGILPLILDSAVGDDRALNATPAHPLRVVQDWCKNINPNRDDPIIRRQALIKALVEWRTAGKDPQVLTQALVYALDPHFEIHSNDPGAGMTLSWSNGHLSDDDLKRLLTKWPTVKGLLEELPEESWYHLVELLDSWAFERTGIGYTLSKEQSATLNRGAVTMLDDLVALSKDMPGIQSRLKELAHHLKHKVDIPGDREYDILFPRDEDRRNYQANFAKQREAVKVLAAEYKGQSPTGIIRKVIEINEQAGAARQSWPDHTPALAAELAEVVTNLEEWAQESITAWDNPQFSGPFLLALQDKQPDAARPILLEALKHPRHKYSAAEAILRRPFQDDELWRALHPLLGDMGRLADILVLRQETDELTVVELLKHPSEGVGLMVAAALAHIHKGDIPQQLLQLWEEAIIRYKFQDRNSEDYHVSTALKQHPETIPKWFKAKIVEEPTGYFDGISQEAEDLLPLLTSEQRLELIRTLPDTGRADMLSKGLVADDLDLFRELLANKNTKGFQLRSLGHRGGESWVSFVEAALKAGWDEKALVAASASISDGWSGPASLHYEKRMHQYDTGLQSTNPQVAAIAQKCTDIYRRMQEHSRKEEKREEVYGFDAG